MPRKPEPLEPEPRKPEPRKPEPLGPGPLKPGARGRARKLVEEADLASAFGNPEAQVLATMVLATLLEQAALSAVEEALGADQVCVGSRLDFSHLAPTPPGFRVTAEAELVEVEGRRLVFKVSARDEADLIAEGTHERFILDKDRFRKMVAAKAELLK